MNFITDHLLSFILFVPAIAAVIMLFLPNGENKLFRWFALGASLIPFALSLIAWFNFRAAQPGFQFEEIYPWYEAIGSSLHLGVDGLSLTMVLLTTLLTPLAILASFNINDKVKAYMMLFLFLETGMLGVFMALDLLIFCVFWEIGLVRMSSSLSVGSRTGLASSVLINLVGPWLCCRPCRVSGTRLVF